MQALLRVSKAIDALTAAVGSLITWIVTLMILIGFLNVVGRYFGRIIGTQLTSNALIEAQWYLYSIMFLLGFAYILKNNLNVRVDFLYTNWTPQRRALVDLLGTLIFLIPYCLLALYVAYPYVMSSWGRLPDGSWGNWEISPDPDGLPRAPIKTMLLIGFGLLLLQAISQVIKYLAVLTHTISDEEAAALEEYHQFEEVEVNPDFRPEPLAEQPVAARLER